MHVCVASGTTAGLTQRGVYEMRPAVRQIVPQRPRCASQSKAAKAFASVLHAASCEPPLWLGALTRLYGPAALWEHRS